jgi:hypothetical protein
MNNPLKATADRASLSSRPSRSSAIGGPAMRINSLADNGAKSHYAAAAIGEDVYLALFSLTLNVRYTLTSQFGHLFGKIYYSLGHLLHNSAFSNDAIVPIGANP